MRPRYFEHAESSGCHEHVSIIASNWDVDSLLKYGGNLFTGGTDLEATHVRFDDIEVVL